MRFYKLNGVWQSWDYLHNELGYAKHATANMSYKSAHPTTWGESAGSGYFDGDQTDMVNGSFWSDEDNTAWHTLNSLALDVEVYPADATDCAMEKDGVQSDAVSIESDGVTYYLIRNVWDSGWMSESEAAAEGWEPAPAYTEITLYMQSGNKRAQKDVTSAFTGDANATYCHQLYTDEECTTPWNAYDYSNDYEFLYNGVVIGIQKVSDLPSTTVTSGAKLAYVLMDTGRLWLAGNMTGSGYQQISFTSLTLRIYPKSQQHYAAYFNYDNAYANNTFSTTTKVVYFSPTSGASARFFGHYIADNGTLVDVFDSGGSSVKKAGDGLNTSSVAGNSFLRLEQSSSVSRSARVMTFTLSRPTFIGWLHVNHTDQSVTSMTVKRLLDDDGNAITYNANLKYTAVCIFSVSNSIGNEATFNGQYCIGSDDTYPGELCFKQIYGSMTVNRIWVAMETVNNYIWAYFTSSGSAIGTNTPQTNATVYPLYDESGAPILYDATKQYETLEVQYISNGQYLMRGNVKYSSYEGGTGGQLQCTATATNSVGAKRIKVWIKPLPEIDIDVNFGDPVTIPAGYEVESVTCSRGYAFASNVSSESSIMGQFVHYELSGEKIYFDDTNTALVGVGVVPALQIYALTDLNNSGYYVSTKSGTSTSYLTAASASYLNSDGYFVKGSTTYNDSEVMNKVASGMQTFPVYFNLADSSGNWLYFCFRVPQTLWQFQNGTFTWLGDTTDASDLAYWYNTRAVRINLRPMT